MAHELPDPQSERKYIIERSPGIIGAVGSYGVEAVKRTVDHDGASQLGPETDRQTIESPIE